MIYRNSTRGFTLIELLVVIAIIGILSSVVLASLNSARAGAADSAVKANLSTVRKQAEIYYDSLDVNSYAPTVTVSASPCVTAYTSGENLFGDTQIKNAITAAANAGGGLSRCATDGSNYAVSVRLKKTTSQHWCVDSTGQAKTITNLTWTGVACP